MAEILAGRMGFREDGIRKAELCGFKRLVLKCQVPRPGTGVTRTLEAIVTEKFKAVGLENYLHVIRIPRIQDL